MTRPSVDDLVGIDPDWTGGMTTDEYIQRQRVPECPVCPGVPLASWSESVFVSVCPCCSSRWRGSGQQIHEGSHNDYAAYLCGQADD